MNLKRLLLFIMLSALTALSISFIPVLIYYFHFRNLHLSGNPSDWSDFGGFASGTTGAILSFFALLFSLVSLYLTLKISKQVQDGELKVTHLQVKPYCYLDLTKYDDKTSVNVQNKGLGPLVIKKWVIIYNTSETFQNFRDFLSQKYKGDRSEVYVTWNSALTHILSPDSEKMLLEIKPANGVTEKYKLARAELRNLLKDLVVEIEYEDIFENKFSLKRSLKFFQKQPH